MMMPKMKGSLVAVGEDSSALLTESTAVTA
jgi:hypothetical protein